MADAGHSARELGRGVMAVVKILSTPPFRRWSTGTVRTDMAPADLAAPGIGVGPSRTIKELAFVGVAGLLLGALTSFGQTWLPDEARSIANSAGTWSLLAMALASVASSRWRAAMAGAEALIALVAGYFIASVVRDFAVARSVVTFWMVCAVLVGPVLGLGALWIRSGRAILAAMSAGSIAGVLIGEGVYGLRFIADTTYPPFWWAEVVAGIALLGAVAVARLREALPVVVALGWATVVAAGFVALYSRGSSLLG